MVEAGFRLQCRLLLGQRLVTVRVHPLCKMLLALTRTSRIDERRVCSGSRLGLRLALRLLRLGLRLRLSGRGAGNGGGCVRR